MTKIFVFGTLKRGFPLHRRGRPGAEYLGWYRTAVPYTIIIAGRWFAPMMFDQPGIGKAVAGELYDVDAHCLRILDRLESIGEPGNFRNLINVVPIDAGETTEAFAMSRIRSWHRRCTRNTCQSTSTTASFRPGRDDWLLISY